MGCESLCSLEDYWGKLIGFRKAGISHCFVNLGSDHPAVMEAIAFGRKERPDRFPRIITCPNEMVALSMADGYARSTGKVQCVIVHVDVGTQALAAAVHNASVGRVPVMIFAGLSPITQEGEALGSRTEAIHWVQDVHDQRTIIAQYCRYTAEIRTGKNVKQVVNRALQFATSAPAGPVYLTCAREVLEEQITPYSLHQRHWRALGSVALPEEDVKHIASALVNAERPLVVTGYLGRRRASTRALVELADMIKGLRVLDTVAADMSFPASHPGWLGLRFGNDDSIRTADVILVLDCDVPWIPLLCQPQENARVFHIDVDPLKMRMPLFYIAAEGRWQADAGTVLKQLKSCIEGDVGMQKTLASYADRAAKLQRSHQERLACIVTLGSKPNPDGTFGTAYLTAAVRRHAPPDTIFVAEPVTQSYAVHDQIQATEPGQWLHSGAAGLGWSGGAALGVKLATDAEQDGGKRFVCQIVGDGTYLFSVPSAVYWISRRYKIPILTIVLNNKGWNAPKGSLLLVHPDGLASKATNEELDISFDPTPHYAGIAREAAGGEIWAARVSKIEDLEQLLAEAVQSVLAGRTAVLDAQICNVD